MDRFAFPLFVVVLLVARLLAPKPEWVLSVDGHEVAREKFGSLSVEFPPLASGWHQIEATTEGMRLFRRYEASIQMPSGCDRVLVDYVRTSRHAPSAWLQDPLPGEVRKESFVMFTVRPGCRVGFAVAWSMRQAIERFAR